MKKRFGLLLASVLVMLGIFTVGAMASDAATSGTCGENVTWVLDDAGTLTISGSGDMENYSYSENPYSYKYQLPWGDEITAVVIGSGVTSIGDYAFACCDDMTSVEIPDSVARIGMGAFDQCRALKAVVIPSGITSIEKNTFRYCTGMTSVEIPDSVMSIGSYAFYDCEKLTEIEIPDSVTSIGKRAFCECFGLVSMKIPDSVTSIGEYAFSYCHGLKSVTIPPSMTDISPFAFCWCSSLTDVYYAGSEDQWNQIVIGGGNDALTDAAIHFSAAYAEGPFADVHDSNVYYYEPVLWAYDGGIVCGTDDNHFSPEACCTRAQVVMFLYRAAGEPDVTGVTNPFTDVKSGEYYYDAVLWGYQKGIVCGTEAGRFSPDAEVTRAQFLTFLWRFAHKPEATITTSPFTDVPAGAYYTAAVLWGYENGIVYGTGKDTFSPEASCTRGQVVTFLYRYLTK